MSEINDPANRAGARSQVLVAQQLHKTYQQGTQGVSVLRGVDLSIARGERVAVIGRSGSGKSTLMHLLAGLDEPDTGSVLVAAVDLTAASISVRAKMRNRYMGFVYQFHHLLPEFTAQENVAMPLRLGGTGVSDAMARAAAILDRVGMTERLRHRPSQLSGGERQRVAVARALVADPIIVLADEPTGNLDQENAEQVFGLMCELSDERGTSFVIVTHEADMLEGVHRVVHLLDGVIQ